MLANSLSGPAGDTLSEDQVARSGDPTGVESPDRATYSAEHTVRSLTTIEVATGHHHGDTPRLVVDLPTPPWTVRFYLWVPDLQEAGSGIDEVRDVVRVGSWRWTVHETAAGNIGTRMQSTTDLRDGARDWDDQNGTPVPLESWWRVEMVYDGTDLEITAYDEHEMTGRINGWESIALGETLEVTGYRWHRDRYLEWDDVSDLIQSYQERLISLGYDLPTWGADGHYGEETRDAFEAFQTDYGMDVGAGEPEDGADPDVLAAVDLAYQEGQDQGTPPPVYLSHLAVQDGTGPVGPAETPAGRAHGTLETAGVAAGRKRGRGTASGALVAESSARGHAADTGARGNLVVSGQTTGRKHTRGVAPGSLVLSGSITGRKRTRGSASGSLVLSGGTTQGVHPIPLLDGRGEPQHLSATAIRV